MEQRRHTKVIQRFLTEKSCLKLVFSTLWQASARWQGVGMSVFVLQQIALLPKEPGLNQIQELPTDAQVVSLTPSSLQELSGT